MAEKNDNENLLIPMMALRGLNIFPEMLMTFDVERQASIGSLSAALQADHLIFLAAQKDIACDVPEEKDIYRVGTVCRIRQQLRQRGGEHIPRGAHG